MAFATASAAEVDGAAVATELDDRAWSAAKPVDGGADSLEVAVWFEAMAPIGASAPHAVARMARMPTSRAVRRVEDCLAMAQGAAMAGPLSERLQLPHHRDRCSQPSTVKERARRLRFLERTVRSRRVVITLEV